MDTLIRRYKRLLTATSTTYIRSLMNTINWDNRLIAIRGALRSWENNFNASILKTSLCQ